MMRILFVAPLASPHPAHWINQLCNQGWDIHVFDPEDAPIPTTLSNVTVHSLAKKSSNSAQQITHRYRYPFYRGQYTVKHRLPLWFPKFIPATVDRLSNLISRVQPNVIHSLRTQDEGYLTLEAVKRLNGKHELPWIHSTYGSDFYYFGRLAQHQLLLKSLATTINYLICDCTRDVNLVRSFGFDGEVLGIFPCSGGIDVDSFRSKVSFLRPSQRDVILIRGKENWAARGLTALRAIEHSADILKDYRVWIHSPSSDVSLEAQKIAERTGLNIEIISYQSREDMIRMRACARLEVSISVSDGTPNNMLEAMAMGVFPIQSNTAATSEWIIDGFNGYSVPHTDIEAISEAIFRACKSDELVDNAAEYNYKLIKEKVDVSIIKPGVLDAYHRAAQVNS